MNKKVDIWLHDHDSLKSYNINDIYIRNIINEIERLIEETGFKFVKVYVCAILTNKENTKKEIISIRCKTLKEIINACLKYKDPYIEIIPDYTEVNSEWIKCPKCGLIGFMHYSFNPQIKNFRCKAMLVGVNDEEYPCNFEVRQDIAIELYRIPF